MADAHRYGRLYLRGSAAAVLALITTAFHVWTNRSGNLFTLSRDTYAAGMPEAPTARELDITLERNSPVPLYYQLAQSIEHAINTGALAPGDRLENELSMTSRLGLSRPTARQAIQELVKKGMLVRKRGVGTQVVRSQFRRDERLSSFNEDLTKAGKVPGTRLLEYEVGELDQDIRDSIDAENVTCETFIKIRRLRLADDVPLAVLTNYLPSHFDISPADLSTKGLYACLRSIGVNLKIGHQRISARLMTDEEAELLDAETPAACLTVDRIAYDDVGQFVEFGRHMYHAAHYSIQSSLVV
jgi:GntR family transcriptional regulator